MTTKSGGSAVFKSRLPLTLPVRPTGGYNPRLPAGHPHPAWTQAPEVEMVKRPFSSAARSQRGQTATDITSECPDNAATSNDHRYTLDRRGRHWEVRDPTGTLVCLTVYKRGAAEVIRRLSV